MANDSQAEIKSLREAIKTNPDLHDQVRLIQLLSGEESSRSEARDLCFKILSSDSKNNLVRLLLARLFYLDNYFPFALRELIELKTAGLGGSLDKLLLAFGTDPNKSTAQATGVSHHSDTSGSEEEDSVLAEIDIDSEFISAIEEEDS